MLFKKMIWALFSVMTLTMLNGCGSTEDMDVTVDTVVTTQANEEVTTQTVTEDVTMEEQTTEVLPVVEEQDTETQTQDTPVSEPLEKTTSEEKAVDAFVGTYNDYDNNEPNLTISLNEDGTYGVVIGIFRLTSLEDGVGILSGDALEFTATDAAGNPIEGVITLEGNEAVVTFTNSTWELIENGTSYRYWRAE